jgi:hypothetical protein
VFYYDIIDLLLEGGNIMGKYDIVLLEVCGETGLTRGEINSLLDKIKVDEVYPLEILSDIVESCAMGFITTEAANVLDFDYSESGLVRFVQDIMDDANNETETGEYEFKNLNILLVRNI